MNYRKLVRIQEKGQVTIPTEIRKKLGLKRGDLVAVMEMPEGVFITPQQVVASKVLDSIGDILKEQGISLEELIASGRQIRADLFAAYPDLTIADVKACLAYAYHAVERLSDEDKAPSPEDVARSREGIGEAAGSWKDIDTAAFKAYIATRRHTANRPSIKL